VHHLALVYNLPWNHKSRWGATGNVHWKTLIVFVAVKDNSYERVRTSRDVALLYPVFQRMVLVLKDV